MEALSLPTAGGVRTSLLVQVRIDIFRSDLVEWGNWTVGDIMCAGGGGL